ncbi:MAG: lamin tail domain-containing protein [Verrucomicrobia bacterium]|nr:lamin tail domain-containing protein [Verrucomicrobiota bacterium]
MTLRSVAKGWLLGLGLGGLLLSASAEVIISEFQAANRLTLKDDDGDAEDWIELHNAGSQAVNLEAWTLTDKASDPAQWRFPAVILEGGQYLVVFASGKDRAQPGSPLHTNFRLGSSGEYLGLYRPDGTAATLFAPAYPPQLEDVSYGLPLLARSVALVEPGAPGRLLVPGSDHLGASWIDPGFDDAPWPEVFNGVGFDLTGQLTPWLGSDVGSWMRGVNASAYLRLPFFLDDATALDALSLQMRYDDGFVAFLNGVRVASRNAPVAAEGGLLADSAADWSPTGQQALNNWYYGYYNRAADADGSYDPYADFNHQDPLWAWNGGAWVLGPGNPPWDAITPGGWHPNGDNSGGVHWAIRRWVSEGSGSVACQLTFAKENPACGSGTTLRVLQNGVERFHWTLTYNDVSGLSTNLVLNGLEEGDYLDFALDPLGSDGTLGDGCDGSTFAVRISQSPSAGATWNSTAFVSRTAAEATAVETFSLNRYRELLVAGTNVIAFQGLNVRADDEDFLLHPQLLGTAYELATAERVYFTQPTPGAPNNSGTTTLGPLISQVEHVPNEPSATQDLWVRAQATRSLGAVNAVTLRYRVMYGAETSVPMWDDGAHQDGAAGDGVYGARIPAGLFAAGQMVRYCVEALDDAARRSRSPAFTDPLRGPEYYGTVVRDPALADSRLPVLHWFVQNPAAADTDTGARGSLFFEGEFYDNIRADIHGQSTRSFPKKSYDLDFHPGYNFRWSPDAPRVDDLNLLTTWADKSHLRNVIAHETYRDAGAASHFALAVRVQQNGAFFSVANLVENGDDNFLQRLGLDSEGALYKMYNSAESVAGAEKKTRKYEGTADLQGLIDGLSQANPPARQAYLFDHLDVPATVNFLAAKIITADTDCCHKNYYLYRDSEGTGEWRAMPWDVDLSFGRVWTCGTPCYSYYDETIYTNTPINIGYGNRVFTPIYDTPATRQMFLRRLRTLMDSLLQAPDVTADQDFYRQKTLRLRDQLAPDATLDLARWGTWGNRETITQAVNRIWGEFLPGRRRFLFETLSVNRGGEIPLAQPADAVVRLGALEFRSASGNPLEEWLSVTNANSFAVDLSGWRLDGAVRFVFRPGTVVPAQSALYVSPDVRAFRGRSVSPRGGERRLVVGPYEGDLSAWGNDVTLLDQGDRVVYSQAFAGNPSAAQSQLRITEIFYHPDPLPAHPEVDAAGYEFVELRNIGDEELDLAGVRFTDGIAFDFGAGAITRLAPGARLLVVRDLAAFASRYGAGLPVAGQYSGALDNAGERLRLADAFGETILDFVYDDDWHPITDGHGFSLGIVDEALPWSAWGEPASWRPTATRGGAPGLEDSFLPAGSPVVIEEFLAHTDPPLSDAIELRNSTTATVDVSGWYLTDDFAVPRKYRLPQPTQLAPGAHLAITELQFNPTPGQGSSFALDSEGDALWLFSADAAGELTGYLDGVEFGATANGVSLGRHVNSVGEVDYPPQRWLTFAAPNAGPHVGPVVLSEIMYHPPVGMPEVPASYLELANVSATSVPLHHPVEITNTWRLNNAVRFDFPMGVALPAGGRLLVVGFDPASNPVALADFRARYGLGAEVPIYGPWNGRLNNADDTIELEQPDDWGTNGVPYVMVEKVHYLDREPWPATADGQGASLQRLRLDGYGNEPTNWFASTPTPGAANHPNLLPLVRMTSPAPDTVFQKPGALLLAAAASDSDGTIQRVEFHAGDRKLAEVSAAPYSYVWADPTPGQIQLRAVAVDDRLGSATSDSVSLTVLAQAPSVRLELPLDGTVALAGSTLELRAVVEAGEIPLDRVRFFSGNTLLAEVYAPPFAYAWSSAALGTHALSAVVVDTFGVTSTSAVVQVAFVQGDQAQVEWVTEGSIWKYQDTGSNLGTAWVAPAYNDAPWPSGPAQLGYGDGDEQTVLGWGPNANQKYITTYFRRSFAVIDAAAVSALEIRLLRDDGALVYLNGELVARSNLPEGAVDWRTPALVAAAGLEESAYHVFAVPPNLLREGVNTLAVEVHQSSPESSDLSFDLALAGTQVWLGPAVLIPPQSQWVEEGDPVSFTVTAGGTAPLAYQWRHDGRPLPGAHSSTLNLGPVGIDQLGSYDVVVTNRVGSTVSTTASLRYGGSLPAVGHMAIVSWGTGFRLSYRGTAGRSCAIQRSVDLTEWETVWEETLSADGVLEWFEGNPPPSGAYYRVWQP